MNGLTLVNTLNMAYMHMVTNAANPFSKINKLFQWGSSGLKAISISCAVLGIVACGLMFMLSDRLSEKAKPRLWSIAIGLVLVGGATLIVSAIKSVTY